MSQGAGQVELQALLDRLTGLDEIHEELQEINQHLQSQETPGSGKGRVATSEDEVAYQYEFSTLVPAGTPTADPLETVRTIPTDGRIEVMFVGWPAGAQQAVGVQLAERGGEKLFPRNDEDDFVAMDDFFHPFDLGKSVAAGNDIVGRFVNLDSNNDHFVNLILTIVTEEANGA